MRTRQKPRRPINLAGRYFTGLGEPVEVIISDVSEGGCRFPKGANRIVPGSPLQITIAGSGPHRATVRWVDRGEVGVIFARPLSAEQVAQLKGSHVPDLSASVQPDNFEPMPDLRPQRFC